MTNIIDLLNIIEVFKSLAQKMVECTFLNQLVTKVYTIKIYKTSWGKYEKRIKS